MVLRTNLSQRSSNFGQFCMILDRSAHVALRKLLGKVTLAEADFLNARWDKDMDTLLRVGVLRYGGAWEEVSTHMAPHGCPKDEVEKR